MMQAKCIALIDFSEYSVNLVKYAFQWAEKLECELLLLHSYEVVSPGMSGAENVMHLQQLSKQGVEQDMKKLISDHLPKEANVKFSCSTKPLSYQLKEEMNAKKFNLVFLGVKGTGALKKIFLGSEVIRVIEETNDLVIALPKGVENATIEKLHIGISSDYRLNTLLLYNFLQLCGNNKPVLHFFHLAKQKKITVEIENLFEHLNQLFGKEFKTEFNVYESENLLIDIKQVIENNNNELIVLQRGSRYFLDQVFRKMLINDLVYEGNTPLMVLP